MRCVGSQSVYSGGHAAARAPHASPDRRRIHQRMGDRAPGGLDSDVERISDRGVGTSPGNEVSMALGDPRTRGCRDHRSMRSRLPRVHGCMAELHRRASQRVSRRCRPEAASERRSRGDPPGVGDRPSGTADVRIVDSVPGRPCRAGAARSVGHLRIFNMRRCVDRPFPDAYQALLLFSLSDPRACTGIPSPSVLSAAWSCRDRADPGAGRA